MQLNMVQRFKQDACVLTMVGSFLDCSGATLTHLVEEASRNEGTSEGTRQLVRTVLELEHSRGWAVGHLLSSAIMLDCNVKLDRHGSLLPSMALPSALATEAYPCLLTQLGLAFLA